MFKYRIQYALGEEAHVRFPIGVALKTTRARQWGYIKVE